MKKNKWIMILLNLVLVMGFFIYAIVQKEKILTDGSFLLFELAPYDSRSLIQGEYMNLRYTISDTIRNQKVPKRGFVVVEPDSFNIARYIRIHDGSTPPGENQYLVEYSSNPGLTHIGAAVYFMEEGQAAKYARATYGGLKLDQKGNSILTGLYDAQRKMIR